MVQFIHKLMEENIMKKIICKVEYDTENAVFIDKKIFGTLGDSEGYEECLFKTLDGKYFIYVNGGAESQYKKEDIKRISLDKAELWLKNK